MEIWLGMGKFDHLSRSKRLNNQSFDRNYQTNKNNASCKVLIIKLLNIFMKH